MKDFEATISDKSERKEEWEKILGCTTVPLQSPIPQKADLPGKGVKSIYLLDLDLMSDEQKDSLAKHIAAKFNVDESTVRRDIQSDNPTHGVPILADDVIVTIHNPHKWL